MHLGSTPRRCARPRSRGGWPRRTGRPTSAWRRRRWPPPSLSWPPPAAAEARRLAPNEPDVHFLSGKVALARGDLAGGARAPGTRLGDRPGAQRGDERARPDPAARHDTSGAIRHFISAARTTPGEHIYSRNIDVVILRSSVPDDLPVRADRAGPDLGADGRCTSSRFPFVLGFAVLLLATMASFTVMVRGCPARRGPGPAHAAHPPGRDRARGGRRRGGRRVRGGHLRPARRAAADAAGRHHRHDRRPDTRYRPAPLPCWQKLTRRPEPARLPRPPLTAGGLWGVGLWGVGLCTARPRLGRAYHVPLSPRGPLGSRATPRLCSRRK